MQTIQDFLRWAAALPPAAKVLVSIALVAVCAVLLVVLWSKPKDPSIVGAVASEASLWPANKTMDGLRARLDLLSRENAKLLVEVASADQYGLYINDVAQRLKISRTDADTRSKELQSQGLIDIYPLTDLNFRLNRNLRELLGPDPLIYLTTYLKQQPVGASPHPATPPPAANDAPGRTPSHSPDMPSPNR
jgi:hypothetical protein